MYIVPPPASHSCTDGGDCHCGGKCGHSAGMGAYAPGSAPAPLLDLSYAASDVALPGESVPADPYGALAYLDVAGGTVSPTVAQLQAAGVIPGAAAPSAPLPSLTDTFTIGGFQVPYWAIGAGVGVWLLSRRK